MNSTSLKEYLKSSYSASSINKSDKITVRKSNNSDWSHIDLSLNNSDDDPRTTITLRSKAAAESLHFMLGQMLKGDS